MASIDMIVDGFGVRVDVLNYEREEFENEYDAGWLSTLIVAMTPFGTLTVPAALQLSDIDQIGSTFEKLIDRPTECFEALEGALGIEVTKIANNCAEIITTIVGRGVIDFTTRMQVVVPLSELQIIRRQVEQVQSHFPQRWSMHDS